MPTTDGGPGKNAERWKPPLFTEDFPSLDELAGWDESAISHHADKGSLQQTLARDHAWQPLADFIQQLPALTDFIYACSNQLPPCLLEVLHRLHPTCRLHIKTFRFRSLNSDCTHPYELAIATSPLLHSITAVLRRFEWDRSAGYMEDYNEDAIIRTIECLAPNLKEVYLRRTRMKASHSMYRRCEKPRPAWKGFTLQSDPKHQIKRRASLSKLALKNQGLILADQLERWHTVTDLSALRTLKAEGLLDYSALDWITFNSPFKCLETLTIEIFLSSLQNQAEDAYCPMLDAFLAKLPALKNLKMSGNIFESTYDTICRYHGPTLRRLWLDRAFLDVLNWDMKITATQLSINLASIEKLRVACPLLEDLKLTLPRSQGDEREMAMYKAIGAMPRLQTLSLTLEAIDPNVWTTNTSVPTDTAFDLFDQEFYPNYQSLPASPRNGHIRNILVNSALDDALAEAIFETVSNGKGQTAAKLESLTLQVDSLSSIKFLDHNSEILFVASHIGQPWQVVRDVRDDRRDKVHATSLWRRAGTAAARYKHDRPLSREFQAVLRRVWPKEQDADGAWTGEWHSFPLQSETP